jgi:CDP-diacylglycerol---serine O-phosphatidyltransferase
MKRISIRRSRKRRTPRRRRPINVLASALTTMGLYCGIRAMFSSIDGEFEVAALFILGAIIFDSLDGTVAKLTKSTSEFGKELDSLCDLVSFGAAPAVLIYTAYLHDAQSMGGKAASFFAVIYVICGALRLARYNVYQSEMRAYFVGLPIPAAAATIATFVSFTHNLGLSVANWVLCPLTLGLAYLMVSSFRYPKDKMKSLVLAPRSAFRWLVSFAFCVAVFHIVSQYSLAIVLFPLAAIYAMFGIVDWAYRSVRKQQVPAPQEEEKPPQDSPDSPPEDDPEDDSETVSNTADFL